MTSPSPLERLGGPGNFLAKEPPYAKESAGYRGAGDVEFEPAQIKV